MVKLQSKFCKTRKAEKQNYKHICTCKYSLIDTKTEKQNYNTFLYKTLL